jgi:hypothetical protein
MARRVFRCHTCHAWPEGAHGAWAFCRVCRHATCHECAAPWTSETADDGDGREWDVVTCWGCLTPADIDQRIAALEALDAVGDDTWVSRLFLGRLHEERDRRAEGLT